MAAADKRARKRFIMSMLLGFLVWLVCGTIVGLLGGEGAGWTDKPYHPDWPGSLPKTVDDDGNRTFCTDFMKALPNSAVTVPSHSDVTHWSPRPHIPFMPYDVPGRGAMTVRANSDAGGPPYTLYKSKRFFHFPMTEADGFYIIGRGRYSVGSVRFVAEEPKEKVSSSLEQEKPIVEVEVIAVWNDKQLLKMSKVCALFRNSTTSSQHGVEQGIGIYTPEPEYSDPYRHLSFEIIVRFPPAGLNQSRLLALAGPSFSPINIALSSITFDVVDIKSENGAIIVHPSHVLSSRYLTVQTSNGRIEGVYNTTDTTRLICTNGSIRAKVNLIQLSNTAASNERTIFTTTTNGNIQLDIGEHPYGIVLNSNAHTTHGNVEVRHGPAFEGHFFVSFP